MTVKNGMYHILKRSVFDRKRNTNNNEFIVYNEWGDEVYYAQPYDNTWSGTYNGGILPSGTYFYVFKPNELQEATKGFLIIQN